MSGNKKGKLWKKNRSTDEDGEIQAILKMLAKSDGPAIEECNRVLNEMVSITADDPLYCMALVAAYESNRCILIRLLYMMLYHLRNKFI